MTCAYLIMKPCRYLTWVAMGAQVSLPYNTLERKTVWNNLILVLV